MNDETGARILTLLDVLSVQMAEGHGELRRDIRGLDANVSGLDAKVDRLDRRLGRVETRVEGVEIELRLFRHEFERRIAPPER